MPADGGRCVWMVRWGCWGEERVSGFSWGRGLLPWGGGRQQQAENEPSVFPRSRTPSICMTHKVPMGVVQPAFLRCSRDFQEMFKKLSALSLQSPSVGQAPVSGGCGARATAAVNVVEPTGVWHHFQHFPYSLLPPWPALTPPRTRNPAHPRPISTSPPKLTRKRPP